MYTSILEAAVRDQQRERLAHAADVRRAHVARTGAVADASTQPAPAATRGHRRAAWHPVVSFHRWLAAGQL